MKKRINGLLLILATGMAMAARAGSIGGTVFTDTNRNGERDPGEPARAGTTVELLGAEGSEQRTTQTAADGSFLFAGLADGQYLLAIAANPQLRTSLPRQAAEAAPVPSFPFGLPRYTAPQRTIANLQSLGEFRHVGLGDSIGFGFNLCGSLLGEDGYIEPTTDRLAGATATSVDTDKQSIPGHETSDLLNPGLGPDLPLLFNDIFYAVDTNAPLVSISIGGNDFLGAEDGGDAELAAAIVAARRNGQEIVSSLVSELPLSDLEINSVYDNLEGDDALHNVWVPIWDQMLRELAWGQARQVAIAEIYPEYAHDAAGQPLGTPGLICDFFGLDEIHPTNSGYDVHEEKLWQAFGGVTLQGGSDRLDVDLGFQRLSGRLRPSTFATTSGVTVNPERGLQLDGVGALVSSDNAEFRVSGFLANVPPAFDLRYAVLKVRYRTTGAPLDDYYVLEASLDGTFSAPGTAPTTWNTVIPIVGSDGNGGAERLAYPDQPGFRFVSIPLYAGVPTSSASAISFEDIQTLSLRVVSTAIGAPDGFSIEVDGAVVEAFVAPAGRADDNRNSLEGIARLASRDPAGARSRILALLADSDTPDPMLLEWLARVGQARDLAAVRAHADAVSPLTRAHAVRTLGLLGGAGVMPDLVHATRDPHAGVRRSAARALGGLDIESSAAQLRRLTRDDDPGVRRIAVRALGGRADAGPLLAELATADVSARVRVAAAAALLAAGNRAGTAALLEVLADPGVAAQAADVLVRHASPDPELIAALRSDEPRQRVAAARALGHTGEASDPLLAALRVLLADTEPSVRLAAADALSRLGDVRALETIASFGGNDDYVVNVARALARFDLPAAHVALLDIARAADAPPTARRLAARALAMGSGAHLEPMLAALAASDDPRVRRLGEAGLRRR